MSACAKRLLQLVRAADVISVLASDDPLKLEPDMAADSMRVDGFPRSGLEAGGVSLKEAGVAALMAEANAAPLREDRMPSFKSTTSEEDEAMETGVTMEVPSVLARILISDAETFKVAFKTASVSTAPRPSEIIEELEEEEEEDTPLSGSSTIAFWLIAAGNR